MAKRKGERAKTSFDLEVELKEALKERAGVEGICAGDLIVRAVARELGKKVPAYCFPKDPPLMLVEERAAS